MSRGEQGNGALACDVIDLVIGKKRVPVEALLVAVKEDFALVVAHCVAFDVGWHVGIGEVCHRVEHFAGLVRIFDDAVAGHHGVTLAVLHRHYAAHRARIIIPVEVFF